MTNRCQALVRIDTTAEQVRDGLDRLLLKKLPPEITPILLPLRGKFKRARLLLAFAEINGVINETAIKLASGIELLHLASLIQDDIVDGASDRQGAPAINRVVGTGATILLSDWLFGEAYHFFCCSELSWIGQINKIVKGMALGELRQELAGFSKPTPSVLHYLRCSYQKTACFFQVCCRLGMLAGGGGSREVRMAGKTGLWWGMAYQLADDLEDLLDLTGPANRIDPDRSRGLLTLPLILLLQQAPRLTGDIWNLPRNELWGMLNHLQIIEQCISWHNRFLSKAQQELTRIEREGPAVTLLREWITNRSISKLPLPEGCDQISVWL
ncbi:MAG TPA: polyprenyl synthetase family protein [Bacillota bacterium]|nr:polyprenyl synthetase family protein [Bacillota bacterium]